MDVDDDVYDDERALLQKQTRCSSTRGAHLFCFVVVSIRVVFFCFNAPFCA